MNKTYKSLLCLFLIAIGFKDYAQVNAYNFSQLSGTYNSIPISGPTTTALVVGNADDNVYGSIPIGFNFTFNGTSYDTLSACVNGWISMGPSLPFTSYTPISSGSANDVISFFSRDLQLGPGQSCTTTIGSNVINLTYPAASNYFSIGDTLNGPGIPLYATVTAISAGSMTMSANAASSGNYVFTSGSISYQLSGVFPNRVFTIQFTKVGRFYFTSTGLDDYINAQIKLYETTNIVEVVYGNCWTNSSSGFNGEVGLRGLSNSDYNNRSVTSSYASSLPGNVNSANAAFNSTLAPVNGQIYRWTPPPPCSGAPSANTVISSLTVVCLNGSTNLNLASTYTNSGFTYQWYSAPSSTGPYTSITGATANNFTPTNINTTIWFQCVITCSTSSASTTATPIQIINGGNACQCGAYCASNASFNFDDEIFNVSIGTLNNTSNCTQTGGPGSILNQYSNYTGIVAAPSLTAGATYPLNVTVGMCGSFGFSGVVTAFMDFNNNGSFSDPGELIYTSPYTVFAVSGTTVSANITIPVTASPGITRLRVIETESSLGQPSCGNYSWGETEDYCINIVAGAPCAGTPGANTVVPTSTNVCPNGTTSFSLATSYTVGGLTYQWSTASTVAGPYNAIAGATLSVYTDPNIAANTWYQCVITCTNGPSSTTATPVQVLVGGSPCQCLAYCTSNATSFFDDEIFNVSIGTLNNSSSCALTGGPTSTLNLYSNYAGILASPNLIAAANYTLSVTVGQCNGNSFSGVVTAYIDYNQNGTFTDPGEAVYTSAYTPFAITGTTFTTVIQVPVNATPGPTRMRIIADESSIPQPPCGTFIWGETEDYCVTIGPPVPCSGAPIANSAIASQTQVCSGGSSNLSLATSYSIAGLTYQWNSSSSLTGPYTPISGANSSVFTATNITSATFYQCVITCTNGPASTTATPVQITILGAPVYATVPFLENFDNVWQNRCDNHNVPIAANWDSNPTTGDQSWRRQDDGATALWSSSIGTVTPLAGTGCANFHTWNAPTSSTGDLNLYVNMNLATTYTMSFYYFNASGADSLEVFLSTNGGATFNKQAAYFVDAAWSQKTLLLSANSPTCVIKFTATSDFGADDIGIDSLKIQSACVPNMTLAASQTTICNGSSVSLTASGAITYTWNTTAITSSISVTPSVTTSYTVSGENTPGCPSIKTVTINVKPSPTLTVTALPSLSLCPGQSTSLTAMSNANTYSWSPGGQITPVITVTPGISTVYNVAVTNSVGCTTNSNVTVFVIVCTNLTKNTVVDNKSFVHPNPNNGSINVVIENSNGNYSFEIMDLAGKIIYKTTLTKSDSALSIRDVANGMYTYRITALDNKSVIKQGKLIKE